MNDSERVFGIKQIEKTLQSIDDTLKRIEKILSNYSYEFPFNGSELAKEINRQLCEEMINHRC